MYLNEIFESNSMHTNCADILSPSETYQARTELSPFTPFGQSPFFGEPQMPQDTKICMPVPSKLALKDTWDKMVTCIPHQNTALPSKRGTSKTIANQK